MKLRAGRRACGNLPPDVACNILDRNRTRLDRTRTESLLQKPGEYRPMPRPRDRRQPAVVVQVSLLPRLQPRDGSRPA
jgi:hypothetical protein